MTPTRIMQGIVGLLRRPLDVRYGARHPGPLGRSAIACLRPIARHLAANDKWTLGLHVPTWACVLRQPAHEPLPPSRRIVLFTLYRGQFTLDITLALLLAWRGHDVTLAYVPRLGSPLKPPWVDHPTASEYLRATLMPLDRLTGGRVRAVDVSALVQQRQAQPIGPEEWAFVERQARSDTIMRLGVETLDPDTPEVSESLRHYRDIGRRALRIADEVAAIALRDADLLLVANGMSFEGAYVVDAAKRAGVDVVTFEKFAFRKMRVLTHGDVIFSFRDLDRLWSSRGYLGLDTSEGQRTAINLAQALLSERRSASIANFAWKYQKAADQMTHESLRVAGLAPDEPFVLVCPNVPFDAGYYSFITLFPSMKAWLVETVRTLLESTTMTVVVRAHPGEVLHYGGQERAADSLAQAGIMDHPRLRFVGPDAAVNTYGLMECCEAGVVFSSTTGIEMAMVGKPVIVGADVYFGRRGFTIDCTTREDYLRRLAAIDDLGPTANEAKRISDEASLFYYLLHFVWQLPYPYDKAVDILRQPPEDLVRSDEMQRYVPFLDSLAMTEAEFARSLDVCKVAAARASPVSDA